MMADEFPRYRLRREELYALVWSEPISAIAKRVGLSDVAISKTCSKFQVPVPPRGYWAKVQAGKKLDKIPLPVRQLGGSLILTLGRETPRWPRPPEPDPESIEITPPPTFEDSAEDVIEAARKTLSSITLPRNLNAPHPAINKLLLADEARREKQRASSYPSYFDGPLFEGPFERRRIKILNALFEGLRKVGVPVRFNSKDPKEFAALVGDQSVTFRVDHPKAQRTGWRYEQDAKRPASETMFCQISPWPQLCNLKLKWQDSKDDQVEDHLKEILISLLASGELQYRLRLEEGYRWEIKRKAELIEEARRKRAEEQRLAEERRIKAEQARVGKLLGDAAAYRNALDIRAYVATVKAINSTSLSPVPDEDLTKWSGWALAQADRIDPVLTRSFLKQPPEQ